MEEPDMPAILALLSAAAALLPAIEEALPIAENMLSGGTPSAADLATLESITAALNAQAAAAETAAGATGPTS
jgi:hypothetical protein